MRESGRTKAMLCELVIVVLFLALSSTTLLKLFAAANTLSRESAALADGVILAQDALERLCAGETVAAEEIRGEYTVRADVEEETSAAGTLHTYRVRVERGEALVTSMETARYCPERSAP